MREPSHERSVEVNGVRYPVAIHVERRRTTRASIGKKGVVIRLPSGLGELERRTHAERLIAWATRRLARRAVPSYRDGEELRAAGRRYVLRVSQSAGSRSSFRVRDDRIVVHLGSRLSGPERREAVAAGLSRCLSRAHLAWLEARVAEWNRRHFAVRIPGVSLRNTTATWGSCSASGRLSFSTRLLLAPPEIVDYVCVHELAHRLVPNHSAAFWNVVRRALPDYEERRRWLRRHGPELSW